MSVEANGWCALGSCENLSGPAKLRSQSSPVGRGVPVCTGGWAGPSTRSVCCGVTQQCTGLVRWSDGSTALLGWKNRERDIQDILTKKSTCIEMYTLSETRYSNLLHWNGTSDFIHWFCCLKIKGVATLNRRPICELCNQTTSLSNRECFHCLYFSWEFSPQLGANLLYIPA